MNIIIFIQCQQSPLTNLNNKKIQKFEKCLIITNIYLCCDINKARRIKKNICNTFIQNMTTISPDLQVCIPGVVDLSEPQRSHVRPVLEGSFELSGLRGGVEVYTGL